MEIATHLAFHQVALPLAMIFTNLTLRLSIPTRITQTPNMTRGCKMLPTKTFG
jgi:hypothetical protein